MGLDVAGILRDKAVDSKVIYQFPYGLLCCLVVLILFECIYVSLVGHQFLGIDVFEVLFV